MSLFLALAAFAAVGGSTPAATPQAKPVEDAEKKICKREEVIGSRVSGKRICRTKAQWDALQQQDQRAIQEMTKLNPGGRSN